MNLVLLVSAHLIKMDLITKEASDLTEAVKQTFYEEYLRAYSESNR
jgi:hypothetical protein